MQYKIDSLISVFFKKKKKSSYSKIDRNFYTS